MVTGSVTVGSGVDGMTEKGPPAPTEKAIVPWPRRAAAGGSFVSREVLSVRVRQPESQVIGSTSPALRDPLQLSPWWAAWGLRGSCRVSMGRPAQLSAGRSYRNDATTPVPAPNRNGSRDE